MYTTLGIDEPIRQGDIFRYLPKIEILLGESNLPLVTELQDTGSIPVDWLERAEFKEYLSANIQVKPVFGIVISQDCDASRDYEITFAEIKPFSEFYVGFGETMKPKSRVSIITTHAQENYKWYYLKKNSGWKFISSMCVDFRSIFHVPRDMLIGYIDPMRLGRLDDSVAYPHFRERVAEYFRRYPYNEWYPFNKDELDYYESDKKFKVDPRYSWIEDD